MVAINNFNIPLPGEIYYEKVMNKKIIPGTKRTEAIDQQLELNHKLEDHDRESGLFEWFIDT